MQLITCPHCGPREEVEFHYGAAAGVAYPGQPADLDDAASMVGLFINTLPAVVDVGARLPGRVDALLDEVTREDARPELDLTGEVTGGRGSREERAAG